MSLLTTLTQANRVALAVYKLIATGVLGYFLIQDVVKGKRHGRRR